MLTILFFILSCRFAAPAAANAGTELDLISALPVDVQFKSAEPSGMTLWRNRLFVVSDNDDQTIYELKIEGTRALLTPHIQFRAPFLPEVSKLDFEGIATDHRKYFYLTSESTSRVLRVSFDGKEAIWITPDLSEVGKPKGLFQVRNGGLEGVTLASRDRLFLCAERQSRGILELRFRDEKLQARAWNCESEASPSRYGRPPDYSDLFYESGKLFALERGEEGIARIKMKHGAFRTESFWSFGRALRDPAYSYTDETYGKAEGLCLDSKRIYVILDNNGEARTSDPTDTRPLFFIFRRPR